MVDVKICGLCSAYALAAAVEGGARFVGFVFYPRSPRTIDPLQAKRLAETVPPTIARVGVFVDPSNEELDRVMQNVRLDMVQLHGAETADRLVELRQTFGVPIIKAISVGMAADLDRAAAFEDVADRLLFDARAPVNSTRPGGNAVSFDWSLLRGRSFRIPWFLAGGLDASNVDRAVRESGAETVDVSSGVEDAPGIKNADKIRKFLSIAST